MKKIIIFGLGQIAELTFDLIKQIENTKVTAFSAHKKNIASDKFMDLPIYPIEEIKNKINCEDHFFVTAISYKNLNESRETVYKQLKEQNFKFTNVIHPNAICRHDDIGENNIIFELNNIQRGVSIGNNNIFWSSNHIGHHSTISNNCFFSSHVVISGSVIIEENNFFGVNATIRDNITIGKKCVIGANSLILKNLPDYSIVKNKATEISKVKSISLIKKEKN